MEKYEFILTRKSGNASLKKGNQMISANDRMHHIVKSQITSYLRTLGSEQEPPATPYSPINPCQVTVSIKSPTKRRMDVPNWYPTVKALLDGMTDINVWTDDNNDVIKRMIFEYGGLSGHKNYIVTITIEEV